jgi:hypothetical protein
MILLPTPAHPQQERNIFDDRNNILADTHINDSRFGLIVVTVFFLASCIVVD